MLNRHIEEGLLETLDELGTGCIGFSALAQGLLTGRYIDGAPASGRAADAGSSFDAAFLSEANLSNVRGLAAIAKRRGQTLAQMAIAWVLRDRRVTSALIGARTVAQLDDSLDALQSLDFEDEELTEIDRFAVEGGIDLWRGLSKL
jgi:L-glyceraldehyde 3-phosphate reductase